MKYYRHIAKQPLFHAMKNSQKVLSICPRLKTLSKNIGPMNGILSAFKKYPNHALLTVPCDLPFFNQETIIHLIENRDQSKLATAFFNAETKFLEPLVCIWEPRAHDILLNYLMQDCNSPYKILMNMDVKTVHAPNAFALQNVNTKDEYVAAIDLINKNFKPYYL